MITLEVRRHSIRKATGGSWGGPLGCCEGARLTYTTYFTEVEFLRLS